MRQHIRCSKQPSGPVQSSTGSIDLTTGLFKHNDDAIEYQRRIRVIQACEKCRRKKSRVRRPSRTSSVHFSVPTPCPLRISQCNGKHPCQRCLARRFRCEYAPERKIGRGVWFHPSVSPKQATPSSATPDHAITDPSTPASSDSSSVASDHQRFESTTPSTLNSYVADISSTQSSPLPPHHGPPEEMHRPRSAMAVGQSSSESSCNASDSSSDVRAAFTRRPRPRPLDPTRDCRKYPPLFSLPIETSVDFRTPFPTGLGPSNSRIVLHSSDAARGALASPSPYCPYVSSTSVSVMYPL